MKGLKDDDTDEGLSDEEMARRYISLSITLKVLYFYIVVVAIQ